MPLAFQVGSGTNISRMNLPNEVQARWCVCQHFGVGEKDLEGINRMKLARARAGENIENLDALKNSLLNAMRKAALTPVAGPVFVTQEVPTQLLFLYEKLRPLLKTDGVTVEDSMWVLAEHVVVPTVALVVVQNRRHGLGTEFDGAGCWYLPEQTGETTQSPIQRVLDRWLRVAGFRTAYGVSKDMKSEPLRRKVDRWRKGESIPTLQSLWHLAGKYSNEVSWLDSSEAWKARFTLACSAQKAFTLAEDYFRGFSGSAAKLGRVFRTSITQEFFEDDGEILLLKDIFWAVRLVERRLRAESKFDSIFSKMPPAEYQKTFGRNVSDEDIERWQRRREFLGKRGNWLVGFFQKAARKAGRLGHDQTFDDSYLLKEFIFELGIKELNRLLAGQRK